MQAFDVKKVPLKDKNLIEASAGTGKTYSIAILVLRLIIEQKLPIHQILMVTFTNAAVAELELRIRKFVKDAYDYSLDRQIQDTTIIDIIENAYSQSSKTDVQEALKNAHLLLDELSVQTIHGFCQQTLTEYAFESNQMFGAELITDQSDIIEREINQFWRAYITTLPVEILQALDLQLLRKEIVALVENILEGKTFSYTLAQTPIDNWAAFFQYEAIKARLETQKSALEVQILEQIDIHATIIIEQFKVQKPGGFTKYVKALTASAQEFWTLLCDHPKFLRDHILLLTDAIADLYFKWISLTLETEVKIQILLKASEEVVSKIQHFKRKNNVLNFDALISNLHHALCATQNTSLEKALRNKFKAIFVDEFQDTDKEQFEIFKTAFGIETIMFLIGDPKQSIYAWRKADINTYFAAKKFVDQLYSMNTNYRSSTGMIEAMNHFFVPETHFDTFGFNSSEEKIEYTKVQSPQPSTKGLLLHLQEKAIPLTISEAPKKEDNYSTLIQNIKQLLFSNQYKIASKGKSRTIAVEDIGILVRNKNSAKEIKALLNNEGIPAIVLNDEKLFETEEAVAVSTILKAILEPTLSNIRQALLTTIINYDLSNIFRLDEVKIIHQFQEFKQVWVLDGISALLRNVIAQFQIQQQMLSVNNSGGKRQFANITQLIEVMHKATLYKNFTPEELYQWLKLGINGALSSEDEYLLRIETDEKAINIVTIHSSKGLEYNIVCVPDLSLPIKPVTNGKDKTLKSISYRSPEGEYMFSFPHYIKPSEEHWNRLQNDQENRRLLYVAVTRSVYACFLYQNTNARTANNSSFTPFVNAIKRNIEDYRQLISVIEFDRQLDVSVENPITIASKLTIAPPLIAQKFTLRDTNWMSMSFSKLNAPHEIERMERSMHLPTKYDQFVFQQLKFGAHTGTYLHAILEKIPFHYPNGWKDVITHQTNAYYAQAKEDFKEHVTSLLQHILHAKIEVDEHEVALHLVRNEQRFNEFEFYFPYENLNIKALQQINYEHRTVAIRHFEIAQLKGLMNGFIDLVFEQNGKFYILDWKSNYLGYSLENYNTDGVLAAMNANGYHLQYLIYTVALTRFLRKRKKDFNYERDFGGVIYLFLRGNRNGEKYGVYTDKPSAALMEAFEQAI